MPKIRPFAIVSNTITTAFTLLIGLPATIVATFLAVALVSSPEPMAKQLALELISLQAYGRDSAPELFHFEVCDKASPIQIYCESHSVVAYTADEVAEAVKRIYFTLMIPCLIIWLLVLVPLKLRTWKSGKEAVPATKA